MRTSSNRWPAAWSTGTVLWLIKLWLTAPVEERDGDGKRRMSSGKSGKRGTPQGGVVSPLLANIYMNRFLKHWRLSDAARLSAPTSPFMPTTGGLDLSPNITFIPLPAKWPS